MDKGKSYTTTLLVGEVTNGVLELRLTGGRRRNVLGRATIDRIEQLVSTPPDGTQVIVISAEAPDFCAGYDLLEAYEGDAADLLANEENFAPLRNSQVPIIAALQGNVIGGGLELALSADIRMATSDVKFAIPASKLGLIYSEAGVRLVVNSLGENFARALFLAGQELNVETALAMGLVTEIVPAERLRERALALAEEVATWSELATSGNRQLLDFVVGRRSLEISELRKKNYAPESDLRVNIENFVKKRRNDND